MSGDEKDSNKIWRDATETCHLTTVYPVQISALVGDEIEPRINFEFSNVERWT